MKTVCQCISPHLIGGIQAIVKHSSSPLFGQKEMVGGNMPRDNGFLIIELKDYPKFASIEMLRPYIRPFFGSDELLGYRKRWCLWLTDAPESVLNNSLVVKRIDCVRDFRNKNKNKSTKEYAKYPHLFVERHQPEDVKCLAVPTIYSESRNIVPIAFINEYSISMNRIMLIPNADLYDFGILSSRMHNVWIFAVCGRLESRISYSSSMCYNTFPWPKKNNAIAIEQISQHILQERQRHCNALGDLYKPHLMPSSLKKLHSELDNAVDCLYSPSGFASDAERLRLLFHLYNAKAGQHNACIDQWC